MTSLTDAILTGTIEAVAGAALAASKPLLKGGADRFLRRDELKSWLRNNSSDSRRTLEQALSVIDPRQAHDHRDWLLRLLEDTELDAMARALIAHTVAGDPASARRVIREHLSLLATEYVHESLATQQLEAARREEWISDAAEIELSIWTALVDACSRFGNELRQLSKIREPDIRALKADILDRHLAHVHALVALRQRSLPSLSDRSDNLRRHRDAAVAAHGEFAVHTPSTHQTFPIERVYVQPRFEGQTGNDGSSIPSSLHRIVILGDPGSGKTSALAWLAYSKATNGGAIPVFLDLREFQQDRSTDMVAAVLRKLRDKYQISDANRSYVEWCLELGVVTLLLDGLDEIIARPQRSAVRDAINQLASLYPETTMIVSSREVGYRENPLSAVFAELRVAPLDDDQCREYVAKWFAAVQNEDSDAARSTADDVLDGTVEMQEIRSNPLLLGVICSLHSAEGSIPSSLREILEKCVDLLFISWDVRRGVARAARMNDQLLRHSMEEIARYCFESPAYYEGPGVAGPELVRVLAGYFLGRVTRRPLEAENRASRVVDYLAGRAWLLINRGRDGETPVFRFVHNTFLEYLTAASLVRRHSQNVVGLAEHVDELMADSRWSEVCFLAVLIWSRAGDVEDLIDHIPQSERRDSLLHHLSESLTLSPEIVDQMVESLLAAMLSGTPRVAASTTPPRRAHGRRTSPLVQFLDRDVLHDNRVSFVDKVIQRSVELDDVGQSLSQDTIGELLIVAVESPSAAGTLDPRRPTRRKRRADLLNDLVNVSQSFRGFQPRDLAVRSGLCALGMLPFTSVVTGLRSHELLSQPTLPISRLRVPPPGWLLLAEGIETLRANGNPESRVVAAFEQLGEALLDVDPEYPDLPVEPLPLGVTDEFSSIRAFEEWFGPLDTGIPLRALRVAPPRALLSTLVVFAGMCTRSAPNVDSWRFTRSPDKAVDAPEFLHELLVVIYRDVSDGLPSAVTRSLLGESAGGGLEHYARLLSNPDSLIEPLFDRGVFTG